MHFKCAIALGVVHVHSKSKPYKLGLPAFATELRTDDIQKYTDASIRFGF